MALLVQVNDYFCFLFINSVCLFIIYFFFRDAGFIRMTSIMEYSDHDTVDVFITGTEEDLAALGEEGSTIQLYEDDIKTEIKDDDDEPVVYVTELPKGIIAAHQELKIPSKAMESPEQVILSQIEHDGKGNSIVTIQVPYLDSLMSNGSSDDNIIELQLTDDIATIKDSHRNDDKVVYPIKTVQKQKQKLPIWKRHTPKPPGYISNYLYPHGLRSVRSRVIIDCPTNIPVPEFKAQLADTSDIVTTLDVAPSTKRKVKELTTNSVSKLFAYPGKPLPSKRLYTLYQRHLTSKPQSHELPTDLDLMPIGYSPSIDYTQVKRITRKRKQPDVVSPTPPPVPSPPPPEPSEAADSESENIVQSVVPLSDQVVRVVIKPGIVGEEEQEILVLHDGSETLEGSASLQHSIEVLLAAAESGKESQQVEQVFICNEGTYDENVTDPFMTEQIIIVQNDLEDEETIETS